MILIMNLWLHPQSLRSLCPKCTCKIERAPKNQVGGRADFPEACHYIFRCGCGCAGMESCCGIAGSDRKHTIADTLFVAFHETQYYFSPVFFYTNIVITIHPTEHKVAGNSGQTRNKSSGMCACSP